MIKHIFFLIIPLLFIIPPAFADFPFDNVPQDEGFDSTALAGGASCPTTVGGVLDLTADPLISRPNDALAQRCIVGILEFDISGIPDGSTIESIRWETDVTSTQTPAACDIVQLTTYDLSSAAHPTQWTEVTTGTLYIDDDTVCDTVGTDRRSGNFGTLAGLDMQTHMTTDKLFSFGIRNHDYDNRDTTYERSSHANNRLLVKYTFGDAVTDLIITDTRATAVDISFSEPSVPAGHTVVGYMINYTTPSGNNVLTPLHPDDLSSNSTVTIYTVSPLSGSLSYSFKVGANLNNGTWTFPGNMSGNVVSTSTLFDPTGAFTPGTFNFTDTGTDIRDIRFEQIRISDTSTRLNVTYPTTFVNFKCDLDYEFAQNNRTYSGLTSIPAESGFVESSFLFTDVQNEIITIYCYEGRTANATNIITQTSIPFVEQIKLFQSGDFGTSGDFGAIDLISLLVFGVIITMGFNRKNEAVGAVFALMLAGALAYFGLITWVTGFSAIIAVIILLVIIQVRKD